MLAFSGIVPKPFEGRIRSVIINPENKQNIETRPANNNNKNVYKKIFDPPDSSCCSRHGYKIMITITITKNNVYEKICDPPDSSCCSRHGYKMMITITITKNKVYETRPKIGLK